MGEPVYSQLESATYIPTSSNEILVKGGALEGFSMLIEDPKRRGITAGLIEAVGHAATSQDLTIALSDQGHETSTEDLDDILSRLVTAGALKKSGEGESAGIAAWQAFVRYGEVPAPELLATIHVVTNEQVDDLLAPVRALGVEVESFALDDYDWAAPALTVGDEQDTATTVPLRRSLPPVLHLSVGSGRGELLRVNQDAVNAGRPVLYAAMDLVDYRVGPYVVPGKTACMWETERQWARASADRSQYETFVRLQERAPDHEPRSAFGSQVFASCLAGWLLELSLRRTSALAGEVIHGRATTSSSRRHSVMRLPRCPVCLPMQPLTRNPLY